MSEVGDPCDSHRWIDEQHVPHHPWRKSFLIEYHGEADLEDVDQQCQQDPNTTVRISRLYFTIHG